MPPGPKKRKAARRKSNKLMTVDVHQESFAANSGDSSEFLSPLPPPPHGNGKEKRLVLIEEEGDERFATPRFQPETPRYPPATPYYSIENLGGLRRGEMEGLGEMNALLAENLKLLDVQTPPKDEESRKYTNLKESVVRGETSEGSRQEIAFEEGEEFPKERKEMKLDESVYDAQEELSWKSDEAILKKLEKLDKPSPFDEEITPKVSIESTVVSSSSEKETKVVPWPDEGMLAGNGDLDVDLEVAYPEKEGTVDGDRRIETELNNDEGLKGAKLENLGEQNKNSVSVKDDPNFLVESVPEMASQINHDLASNKVEMSAEKSLAPAEKSVLSADEPYRGKKGPDMNSMSSVGMSDASSHRGIDSATEPFLRAVKTKVAQRIEISKAPMVVRRATLWNCCGLLEVLTSSDK